MKKKRRLYRHPLWRRWTAIRQALLNKNSPDYKWAGAFDLECVGLDNFDHFAEFVEQEIGQLPNEDMKLHRKNYGKGWIPGNIEWSDHSAVGRNQRKNIFIKIGKQTRSLKEWCEHYNASYWRSYRRYNKGIKGKEIFCD